jgi:D-arabinose 1-dehydrogenase-like Zn-dependent alcohol dehydrogenase
MCAGVTTFNPLSRSGIKPGSLVAVQGIGGLGHLGIQFARKMGFRVAAISSGAAKEALALELGAHIYINTSKEDPVAILSKQGGAALILCTAPDAPSIGQLVEGLARFGQMVVVAAPHDKVQVNTLFLLSNCASVKGWAGGSPSDVEDTIAFATAFDVKPMIETFPLSDAERAYDQMLGNKVRFRSVLDCR